jgi:hypothetical protein
MPPPFHVRTSLKNRATAGIRSLLLLTPLALAACAGPGPDAEHGALVQATVEALPGTDATAIQISNAERMAAKWTWSANAAGKSYACDADDKLRLPQCTPSN